MRSKKPPPQPYQPAGYEKDLSEAEWQLLEPLLYPLGAPSARASMPSAIVLKTGCQWALLPRLPTARTKLKPSLLDWIRRRQRLSI